MGHYEKLVRDRIPEILDKKGVPYEQRIADTEEYKTELIKKLNEEAGEFAQDPSPEELADVMEVIAALTALPEYQDTENLRGEKREKRGGFSKRIILKGET